MNTKWYTKNQISNQTPPLVPFRVKLHETLNPTWTADRVCGKGAPAPISVATIAAEHGGLLSSCAEAAEAAAGPAARLLSCRGAGGEAAARTSCCCAAHSCSCCCC
jgi:hypothetical protein